MFPVMEVKGDSGKGRPSGKQYCNYQEPLALKTGLHAQKEKSLCSILVTMFNIGKLNILFSGMSVKDQILKTKKDIRFV